MPYDDGPTPQEVRHAVREWLPTWVLIAAVILVAGGLVTWGGSEFGWWLNGGSEPEDACDGEDRALLTIDAPDGTRLAR